MYFSFERDIESALVRFVGQVERHAALVLVVILALCVAGMWHAVNTLSINTDSSEMISDSVPFRQEARRMQELFPQLHDQMLVILRAPTPDEADFAALELATRLRADETRFADIFAATVDPFFRRQGLLFLDFEELANVTAKLSGAAPLLENLVRDPTLPQFFEQLARVSEASEEGIDLAIVADAYNDVADVVASVAAGASQALSWQNLFGVERAELNQRVLVIEPELDFASLQPAKPAIDALREVVASLPPDLVESVEIALSGDPILRTEELRSVSDGIEISMALSLLFVSLLLIFGLRSWQLAGVALAALLAALMLTTAFAAIFVGELNLISIAFAVLLIGLGIDFSIHLVLYYREEMEQGHHHHVALARSAIEIGPVLALAALTTAVAFLSFVPTKFVGMAQLGVISGAGVIIACIVSLTLIPALLTLLPKIRPEPGNGSEPGRLGLSVERHARPVALLALLVGAAAASLLPQVRFDADPMSLRDPKSPGVLAFNMLFDRVGDRPYRLNFIGQTVEQAHDFAIKAEALDEVHSAITLEDFVPGDQEDKLAEIDFIAGDLVFVLTGADDLAALFAARTGTDRIASAAAISALLESTRKIAEVDAGTARGDAAQKLGTALLDFAARAAGDAGLYGQLETALLKFFPMQMERLKLQLTARAVTAADLPADIRRRFVAPGGEVRVEVLPEGDVRDLAQRKAFVEAVSAVDSHLSGGAVSALRGGEVVAAAMTAASLGAFFLGALLILLVSRSLIFVIAVMLPLLLAAIMTAASGVLLGVPFNYANVIVLPLLIGLGVDSGLHLVMRTRKVHRTGAVFATSTPRAVLLSALTTIASFGTLALSNHRGMASMGELLMIALALTLLATLVVLPGLMALFGKRLGISREEEK